MRGHRLLLLALVLLAEAAPARGETEFTLPVSYLDWTLQDGPHLTGIQLPLAWFGGPFKLGAMRAQAGGAWMMGSDGRSWPMATGEVLAQLEWPLGAFYPHVGVAGWAGMPLVIGTDGPFRGLALGWMPRVGCRLELDVASLDLFASQGTISGLERGADGRIMGGSMWTAGLRLELAL
jgi:hypothetical protein